MVAKTCMSRARGFLLVVGLGLSFSHLSGCNKKAELIQHRIESEPVSTQLEKSESNALDASDGSTDGASPTLSELVGAYRAQKEYKTRMELAYRISARNSEEALKALEDLFQRETDADLKEDLLDAMSEIKSLNTPQALAIGLDPAQPKEVRMASIDELRFYGDPVAIPSLESLLEDPDPRIREMARRSIDSLKSPRISEAHRKKIFEGLLKKGENEAQTR